MPKVTRTPGPAAARFKVAMVELAKDKVGKVGWFPSSKYEDGTPVAYIASIMELGTKTAGRNHAVVIPPRPFFRPTMIEQEGNWRNLAKLLSQSILKGTDTAYSAMEKLASQAEGDVAATFASINTPRLSDATVELRKWKKANGYKVGSLTKPLQESGYMLSTLTSKVEDA